MCQTCLDETYHFIKTCKNNNYAALFSYQTSVSDTPALSQIQVRHCYSYPPWRVEGVMAICQQQEHNCPIDIEQKIPLLYKIRGVFEQEAKLLMYCEPARKTKLL